MLRGWSQAPAPGFSLAAATHAQARSLLFQEKSSVGGSSFPAGAIEPDEALQRAVDQAALPVGACIDCLIIDGSNLLARFQRISCCNHSLSSLL